MALDQVRCPRCLSSSLKPNVELTMLICALCGCAFSVDDDARLRLIREPSLDHDDETSANPNLR